MNYQTGSLGKPWEDATASAVFTNSTGKKTTVLGFYYDRDIYKVRFVPDEPGAYTYTATLAGPTPFAEKTGQFTATPSSGKGFIRRLSANPVRLGLDDGTIFNALGFNDC